MNILFISTMPDTWWGGSEELWVEAAHEAVEEGHRLLVSFPHVAATSHPKLQALRQYPAVQWHQRHTRKPTLLQRVQQKIERMGTPYAHLPHPWFATRKTFESFSPELVYVNQGWVSAAAEDPLLFWLLTTTNLPYVLLSHQNAEHYILPVAVRQKCLKLVETVRQWYFISERNLHVTQRQLAHPSFTRTTVVRNPCRLRRSAPVPYPPHDGIVRWAFVGRLECMHKGLDLLLDALSTPVWRSRKWELALYGAGPDRAYLEELIGFYRLENRVFFKGFTDEVARIWEEAHLLLLPSIKEGTPLVLLETMQCGRAVLVTDVGDSAALVSHGETGFVAAAPTVPLLRQTLEEAWEVRTQWEQMGQTAFRESTRYIDPQAGKTLLQDMLQYARRGT